MPNITNYATSLISRQLKGINDTVIDMNEYSRWLKKKGRIKYGLGGDSIKWRVYVSEPQVFGSTTDNGSRTAATLDNFVEAELRYAQYDGEIMTFMMQDMRNKNGEENVKLFDNLMESMNVFKQSVADTLGRHFYDQGSTFGNNRGTNILGLDEIVLSTGTYAGLDRATYTTWASQTESISNFELDTDGNDVAEGLEGMRSLWLKCCAGIGTSESSPGSVSSDLASSRNKPDGIFTTRAIYLNYENVLTPQQRYTSASSKDPETELLFSSTPIYWDNFCNSGKMYFLNSKFMNVDCVTDSLFYQDPDFQGLPVAGRNAKTWTILTQLQHYSRNPRYLGVATVS